MKLGFLVIAHFVSLALGEFSYRPAFEVGLLRNLSIVEDAVKILLDPHARKCDLHFFFDRESLTEMALMDRFRNLLPDFGVADQSFYQGLSIMDEDVGRRFRQRKCTAFVAFIYGNVTDKLFFIRNVVAKTDSMQLLLLTDEIQNFLFAFRHIQGAGILDTDDLLFHYHQLPSFIWQIKDLKAPRAMKDLSRLRSDFSETPKIRNLENTTLIASSLSFYFPFTAWMTLENGTQVQRGFEHRILKELEEPLGFNLQHRLPFDGTWGGIKSNGTYIDGLAGDVFYGRADVAFADLYSMDDRYQAMDMISYDYECTMIAVPWPELSRWLTLVYIFEYQAGSNIPIPFFFPRSALHSAFFMQCFVCLRFPVFAFRFSGLMTCSSK